MNAAQEQSLNQHWTNIAGEDVEIEIIGGAVYAFGSELAVRRLVGKLNAGHVGYSANLSTWFYCNE